MAANANLYTVSEAELFQQANIFVSGLSTGFCWAVAAGKRQIKPQQCSPLELRISGLTGQPTCYIPGMTGPNYDPRYVEFFERFNRQRFFEAHEVLEALWLPQRQGPNGLFYKGLIQLAGAFVHWQKNRPGPAAALLGLARANLGKYPAIHDGLDVARTLAVVEEWQ
jgi:hypothetical protein